MSVHYLARWARWWLAIELGAALLGLGVSVVGLALVDALYASPSVVMLVGVLVVSLGVASYLVKAAWPLVVEAWG